MTEMQSLLVNINEASADDLITVNGIGKSLAQRIIDNRPYNNLHDLVKVPGINEVKLTSLLPYLTIGIQPRKRITPTKEAEVTREVKSQEPVSKLGETEAFLFLEDRKEREDALLIIFGGFILGLIILLLRRRNR